MNIMSGNTPGPAFFIALAIWIAISILYAFGHVYISSLVVMEAFNKYFSELVFKDVARIQVPLVKSLAKVSLLMGLPYLGFCSYVAFRTLWVTDAYVI